METMLENQLYLITLYESILVSLWTFQLILVYNHFAGYSVLFLEPKGIICYLFLQAKIWN